MQFLPATYPYATAEGYGIDPIVDSAIIVLSLSGTPRGNVQQEQTFDVWEIKYGEENRLRRDSTYYSNFPIEKYRGRKLFNFKHAGSEDVSARLFPTAAGKEYLDSLVRLHDWDDYTTDSLFLRKFGGWYITPAEGSDPAAALYGTDLTASGIQLHVRNHDTLDVTAIYDTLVTVFMFRDTDVRATSSTAAAAWDNVSVNMTTFDYTGSTLGAIADRTNGFTDTLPSLTPESTLYVQAMGGVGPYLRFSDELVEQIRDLRFKIEQETGQRVGKDIAINQAMMRIWIEDDSIDGLDAAMTRLGSYLNPSRLIPIPDYQYATEQYTNLTNAAQGSSEVYTLPYNGYLNRSNGYYELDITSYIQQLAKVKENDPEYRYISPAIFIAPEAYGIIGPGRSVLKGFGSDKPVAIRITYTIIEG